MTVKNEKKCKWKHILKLWLRAGKKQQQQNREMESSVYHSQGEMTEVEVRTAGEGTQHDDKLWLQDMRKSQGPKSSPKMWL